MSLLEKALKAFETLKQACMNSPVLAFADYSKEFLLETDTSKEGLGASRALTMHEKNYHSTKLKFLALKWAIREHFKEYLPH